MTLWFSATAVLPALTEAWELTAAGAAWMTAAVQLGFVVGAVVSASLSLPDVVPPRRLVAASATVGAVCTLLLAWTVDSVGPALALRFLTGVTLAGVYPSGMKIAAGHVTGRRRGIAIGLLVGALTLGSASPHAFAGLAEGTDLDFRFVLTLSAGLALGSAAIVAFLVRDGPHQAPPAPFDLRQVGRILRSRPVLLADLGYFGHMWELYAVWTWLVVFFGEAMGHGPSARLWTFGCVGVAGFVGAVSGGWVADRMGRTTTTVAAMVLSATCCLLSPWAFGLPAVLLGAFGLVWGLAVIADSAQFSAAVTELADPDYVGTALTLQTSIGFALTLVPIWGTPLLAEAFGWRWAFVALAPGPLLGCWAMLTLRRMPESAALAGGRR